MNWIRRIQLLADKIVGLVLLVGGGLVLAWILSPLPEWAAANATEIKPDATMQEYAQAYTQPGRWAFMIQKYMPGEVDNRNLWIRVSGVCAFVGLLIFMPRAPKTVAKVLRLGGEAGKVDVDLATVQDALNRVVNDLPEVKRIRIKVVPSRDKKRFGLESNVVLMKNDERTAKELTSHVRNIMVNTAKNMVGNEDDIPVRMFVRGVVTGKNLDMINIASRPALATDTPAREQIENKWSQDTAQEPSYLPPEERNDAAPVEEPIVAEEPPPIPEPAPAPEPEPEPSISYSEVPDEERDPVDSIDNIIMVDNNEYDVPSVNPVLDDEDRDQKA